MNQEIQKIENKRIRVVMTNDVSVFNHLHDFVWNPDEISALDFHLMFIGEYGDRIISDTADRCVDSSIGKFTENSATALARMIERRYKVKWEGLYQQYSNLTGIMNTVSLSTSRQRTTDSDTSTQTTSSGNTFRETNAVTAKSRSRDVADNINLSDSGTAVRTASTDDSDKSTMSETSVKTGGYSDTEKSTTSDTNIRSGSMATKDSGTTAESSMHEGTKTTRTDRTGSTADTIESKGTDSIFGFNSANAVPSTTNVATDTTSRATTDSGTTTESPSLRDSTTTSHGKTTTTDYTNLTDAASGVVDSTTTRKYDNETDTNSKTAVRTASKSDKESSTNTKTSNTDRTMKEGEISSDSKSGIDKSDTSSTGSSNTTGSESIDEIETTTGYNIRRLADKKEMYDFMMSSPLFADFFEIVFSDIAKILTVEVFA